MKINEKIKKYIDENYITAKELAEKSGINIRALYDMFTAGRKISVDEYVAICSALDKSLEYFINEYAA